MDIFAYRIIPVVVLHDAVDAEPLGRALIAGGLPLAEVTFRTEAAAEAISILSDMEGLTVGAGTVMTPAQVELAIEAGAQFIVSPGFRADVIQEATLAGKPILPGAVTPTELMTVQTLGIDTVKFFPADAFGGPGAIKALAAPFPGMKFVPTGGVSIKNLAEYLALKAVPAVGGSWMVKPDLIKEQAFDKIAALTRQAVELANSL